MSPLDPRFPGTVGATLEWLRAGVERQRPGAGLSGALARELGALADRIAAAPLFPPIAIPLAITGDRAVPVAAICAALHLAADLARAGNPGAHVMLGIAVDFTAELEAEQARCACRVMAGFVSAMVGGGPSRGEQLGCYARLAALGADLAPEEVEALGRWGLALGHGASREEAGAAGPAASCEETGPAGHGGFAPGPDRGSEALGGLWLPWGARPILEAIARQETSSAGQASD